MTSISDSLASGAVVQYSTRQPKARHTDIASAKKVPAAGAYRLLIKTAALATVGFLLGSPVVAFIAVAAFLFLTFSLQLLLVRLHRSLGFPAMFRLLPALRFARALTFASALLWVIL